MYAFIESRSHCLSAKDSSSSALDNSQPIRRHYETQRTPYPRALFYRDHRLQLPSVVSELRRNKRELVDQVRNLTAELESLKERRRERVDEPVSAQIIRPQFGRP